MFVDLKEEMAKQKVLVNYEREELKCLNDQLLAQITALQDTQGPPRSPIGRITAETQVGGTSKAGGDTEQPPLLFKNDYTADQVRLIPV